MTDLLSSDNDEIDFDRAASAFPDISLDGDSDIPSGPIIPTVTNSNFDGGFDLGDFDNAPVRDVKVTGDEDGEIEKFESEFPDIGVPEEVAPLPSSQPTFGAIPPFAPRPQPSALSSTPILTQHIEEDEPEVIREWRERQAEEIRARDEASKAKRQETISKAERAIDQFYEEYNTKKERNILENKESEATYVASLTDALSQGTTWDRICELIELQNSQSKTLSRAGPGTTELARFREVLLRLRREGTSAPGAAGY
ncbi:hypothetical protein HETIRDRAFT_391469 [Heterobasidion irregulare TC 32-1]|uniref:Clathrin light chain n=1 Tax=Heterobasidion irregulare (strain TC 32-1) TaxID=747525 RepID=W4JMM0_HETIT|nr:uncharacterized protein HETIRDRAFT_391469 [Heterobasidion irregulare TC 32-1]ETW74787.1 hypothetical protein HETIRDRAFT_391469 [Heterobasidion irregulare TC 32-1]